MNLFEVYCKKRKKSKKIILHTENGGVRRSGYTYRGGYTYRAGCISVRTLHLLLKTLAAFIPKESVMKSIIRARNHIDSV